MRHFRLQQVVSLCRVNDLERLSRDLQFSLFEQREIIEYLYNRNLQFSEFKKAVICMITGDCFFDINYSSDYRAIVNASCSRDIYNYMMLDSSYREICKEESDWYEEVQENNSMYLEQFNQLVGEPY